MISIVTANIRQSSESAHEWRLDLVKTFVVTILILIFSISSILVSLQSLSIQ